MTVEKKWENFSDEELLAIHIGLLHLSRDAQLALWDKTPWYELRRRHDTSLEFPLDPIDLLSKYPVLQKEMQAWLNSRTTC